MKRFWIIIYFLLFQIHMLYCKQEHQTKPNHQGMLLYKIVNDDEKWCLRQHITGWVISKDTLKSTVKFDLHPKTSMTYYMIE